MALIDDLTQQITTELHRTIDECIREAIEKYVVGDGRYHKRLASVERFPRRMRRGQSARKGTSRASRESRSRTILGVVAKLGEASVEDVARATGLDKRGVGSSLYYLAAAGKLKQTGAGRYKALRAARAA